jgi:hypothetical protein
MSIQSFATIDVSSLALVSGGQAAAPQQQQYDDAPQSRTWGQVAREYGAACVMGAGQSLVFGGRPRSARDAAVNAAVGCATGVGMKAVEDLSGALSGNR